MTDMTGYGYTEPGANEQSYSFSGFIPNDGESFRFDTADPSPIALRLKLEPNRWRSLAWWLTGWLPRSWRVSLCDRFGHPESCVGRETESNVIPVDQEFTDGQFSVSFKSLSVAWDVSQWCIRCGRATTAREQ